MYRFHPQTRRVGCRIRRDRAGSPCRRTSLLSISGRLMYLISAIAMPSAAARSSIWAAT
jgi:hypothetical protein